MARRYHKKGTSPIVKIILALLIFGVLLVFVSMYKNMAKNVAKITSQNTNTSYLGLIANDVKIYDDPAITTDDACFLVQNGLYPGGIWDCRITKFATFEVNITNGGDKQRSVYGGISICNTNCAKNKACTPIIDDTCIIIQGKNKCSIKNDGLSYTCDGGSYMFSDGTYFIYPVVTCPLDKDTGCYDPQRPSTEPVTLPNHARYLMVRGFTTGTVTNR